MSVVTWTLWQVGGVGRRGREEGVGGKSECEGGRDGWEE